MILFRKDTDNTIVDMISYKMKEKEVLCVAQKMMFKRELVMIQDCFSIIDEDYSLIRYLCKETEYRDISKRTNGYITIKRKDETSTTLGRFILEFYAQFNEKLYTILNNEDYEVNHINKILEDNTIGNLELVTKKGNLLHRDNKPYEDEKVMTSLELQKIQKEVMQKEQYNKDKEVIKRKSGLFIKGLKENSITKEIIKWRCCLDFKYVSFHSSANTDIPTRTNNNSNNNSHNNTNNILSDKFTNFIFKLVNCHLEYIYTKITTHDIKLLNREQERYPHLDKLLSKFRINDRNFINKGTILEKEFNTRTILFDLFEYLKDTKKYYINDDNILIIFNIEALCVAYGKYNAFRIMYILGLLNRRKPTGKKINLRQRLIIDRTTREESIEVIENHDASYIHIPVYTEELLKEANKKAKIILDFKLKKITYFIVREIFGEEIANMVYVDKKQKINYTRYGLPSKEDVIWILKSNLDIQTRGYIFVDEIIEEIERINSQKQAEGKKYSKIFKNFKKFVTSLLRYIPDVKKVMEEERY